VAHLTADSQNSWQPGEGTKRREGRAKERKKLAEDMRWRTLMAYVDCSNMFIFNDGNLSISSY
jgi:hypothetical protein